MQANLFRIDDFVFSAIFFKHKPKPGILKTHILSYATLTAAIVCFLPSLLLGQNNPLGAQVNGNFQMDAQYYRVDSAIGALPGSKSVAEGGLGLYAIPITFTNCASSKR